MTQVVLKNNYGFCEFLNYSDAKDAVRELNGARLLGVRVTVEMARGEVFRQNTPADSRSYNLILCYKTIVEYDVAGKMLLRSSVSSSAVCRRTALRWRWTDSSTDTGD